MSPMVDTKNLIDAQEIARLLRLSHANSVSTYQHRYPDMPRPVLDLGSGRPRLWLKPAVVRWARTRLDELRREGPREGPELKNGRRRP
jgi:hypothetical protein